MSAKPRSLSLLSLAAAAASTVNSADMPNEGRGVQVIIDVTVATTTSVVFIIQGLDPASGKYYNLLTSAALTGVATTVMTVYPGAVVSANVSANAVLPPVWRVNAVITGASSALTATVGANVLV